MSEDDFAYIARCRCGCKGIVMAIVDNPVHKREVAKEIAKCIREGYTIEHVTVGYVRQSKFGCLYKGERKYDEG